MPRAERSRAEVAVIIPTRDPHSPVLGMTLHALEHQSRTPAQVLLSVDRPQGPPPDTTPLQRKGVDTACVFGPSAGPAAARNRALEHATADTILFLNDDAIPAPTCIEEHLAAHAANEDPALVLGSAPWGFEHHPPRVIDRLVAETSMVFFYDRMDAPDAARDPARDWGFRHAWTLNLSLSALLCERFDERLTRPMFDDLEWAWRVCQRGVPVRYHPRARVQHHHTPAYTPERLLAREVTLGFEARAILNIAPHCFAETFGQAPAFARDDSLTEASITHASHAFAHFSEIAGQPGDGVDIPALFAGCRPWRDAARAVGFRSATTGEPFDHAIHDARTLLHRRKPSKTGTA